MHYKENYLTCAPLPHSYLIIIKGLMPNVVESLYHVLTSPDVNPPAWMLHGGNWISIFMLLLVPLCFLRTLHSLRHTSYVALFAVGESALIPLTVYTPSLIPFKRTCLPLSSNATSGLLKTCLHLGRFVSSTSLPALFRPSQCKSSLIPALRM